MKRLQRHSTQTVRILQVGLYAALLCLGLRYYPALRALAQSGTSGHLQLIPQALHSIVGGDDTHRATSNYEASGIAATTAGLQTPQGVALDSHGNLYLADGGYGLVRRVNASDGIITTIAGTNNPTQTAGTSPVPATQVQLLQPTALAMGPNDALYIADAYNNAIYRVDTAGNLTLVAGTPGTSGYSVDGTLATAAQINYPMGLAVDAAGNVYFSEEFNHIVRRINVADGTLTTVAGSQTLGSGYAGNGGQATTSQLNYPLGLALDAAGNLYIADTQNNVIRRIDKAQGTISNFAGTSVGGRDGDGGLATSAQLNAPSAVALDAAGQVYISDSANRLVRKVGVDGIITTVAGIVSGFSLGSGYGHSATGTRLSSPAGIAVDADGSLYIADAGLARVLKAGPDSALEFGNQETGSTTKLVVTVQNPTASPITLTSFTTPTTGFAYAVPPSNGCTLGTVLQPGHSCLVALAFTPQTPGNFTGEIVIGTGAGTNTVMLSGVAVLPTPEIELSITPATINTGDSTTLTATLSGTGNTPTGSIVFTDDVTGNTLATAGIDTNGVASVQFTPTAGVFYISANYDGDTNNTNASSDEVALTVNARSSALSLVASAVTANTGDSISLSATLTASGSPTGSIDFRVDGVVAATAPLAGGSASTIIKAPAPGQHILQAVYTGDALFGTSFSNTLPLTTHGAVLQFNPGAAYTVAGIPSDDLHPGFGGDGGPAISARFHTPSGVATDGGGNIYIADEQNNVIRKVTPDGFISTVAGTPYAGGINISHFGGDGGKATSAYLTNPSSVAVDAAGNLYIADYSNHVIRKVTASTGIITTIAGVGSHPGYNGDGLATSSYLDNPFAVAVDTQGNVFIADYGNHLVRKVDTAGNLTTIAGSYYMSTNTTPISGSPATSVALYHPMGVAISPAGEVYISDNGHNLIHKIDASGNLIRIAGVSTYLPVADNVPATSSAISQPEQMAFDAGGNLYFADTGNEVIRKIDTSGIITTVMGYLGFGNPYYHFDPLGAPSNTFQLVTPSGVAIDSNGNIIATDNFNQTVIRAGATGELVFGPANSDSDPQTITLTNSGDTAMTFSATPYVVTGDYVVTAAGASPCNFAVGLAPGANCTLTVRNHAAAGASGSIVFSANVAGAQTILLNTSTTAQPSATALFLSEDHGTVGDNVLVYGQVSVTGPAATGSISFYDGSTLLGHADLASGVAYIYVSTFAAGTHNITAQYSGGGVYGASVSDPSQLVIAGVATSTTLSVDHSSVNYGTSITFTANVSAADSTTIGAGTVTFSDGSTALSTAPVNASGVATYSTSALLAGSHTITATYNASGSYMPSTSAGIQVSVNGGGGGGFQSDYTLTIDGLPAVIHRGESRTVAVSVQPLSTFTGPVQLSCGTLPAYATCSFSPATVFVRDQSGAVSILTITASPAPPGQAAAPMVLGQQANGMPSLKAMTH